MTICSKCNSSVRHEKEKVQCCACFNWFHASCVNLKKNEQEQSSSKNAWRCAGCVKGKRNSQDMKMTLPSTESSKPNEDCSSLKHKSGIESLTNMLEDFRRDMQTRMSGFHTQIIKLENELGTSLNVCHEKLDTSTQTIIDQKALIDKLLAVIDGLKEENITLKHAVTDLEGRLEAQEQYSRANTLEIFGIPEERDEDPVKIIKDVGTALGIEIEDQAIDACHRLGMKNGQRMNPRGIIVKFTRRLDKELLLTKKKGKRDLSTRHLGRPDDRPIYINESLSPARRLLLAEARRLRKEKQYQFCWVRAGKIRVRKNANSEIIVISSKNDLQMIC